MSLKDSVAAGRALDFVVGAEPVQVHYPANMEEECRKALSGHFYPKAPRAASAVETVVDVGANIGATALYFAHCYPRARVYCFEPSRESFEYLAHNTSAVPRISGLNVGLFDQDGTFLLQHGREQCAQHSIFRSGMVGEQGEQVTLRKASVVLGELGIRRISVLKVDTEGCECQVLADILPAFEVDVVHLEYHSDEDRKRLDDLLFPSHILWFSESRKIHRGQVAYMRRDSPGGTEDCRYRISPGGAGSVRGQR